MAALGRKESTGRFWVEDVPLEAQEAVVEDQC
ncbi:hypothetical protein Goari_009966, partial [Gossypium aridum]|nr:hypothetical protein [Gossypium aridum]